MKEDKVIDEFPIIDFIKNGDENYISIGSHITKDHYVIVCDFWKMDQLMFIHLRNRTRICVSTSDIQPTWESLRADYKDDKKAYYYDVATTKKEIYALYKKNPNNFEIHCFSQTGDFLKKLILKEKLISFDITDSYIWNNNR